MQGSVCVRRAPWLPAGLSPHLMPGTPQVTCPGTQESGDGRARRMQSQSLVHFQPDPSSPQTQGGPLGILEPQFPPPQWGQCPPQSIIRGSLDGSVCAWGWGWAWGSSRPCPLLQAVSLHPAQPPSAPDSISQAPSQGPLAQAPAGHGNSCSEPH